MEINLNLQPVGIDSLDQLSILVVDDNIDEQLFLHYLLRQQIKDVLPVGAISGHQAWTYLKKSYARQHTLPSLILLDLYLPRRNDGLKLLRRIRSHSTYHDIPVVMVSASADLHDIEQSYYWGANNYIIKPLRMESWPTILSGLPLLVHAR